MRKIILASASPRRRELLNQIGLKFEVIPSHKDEVIGDKAPAEAVMALAAGKAGDIYDRIAVMEGKMTYWLLVRIRWLPSIILFLESRRMKPVHWTCFEDFREDPSGVYRSLSDNERKPSDVL